MPGDPAKRKASRQRYNQSDKGKANQQGYKGREGKAAAERRASAASASLAFVTELKGQPHAQRVGPYFSGGNESSSAASA
jgi:hypothetical protein